MNKTGTVILLLFIFTGKNIFSQVVPLPSSMKQQWNSALSLSDNVFIENKGQFDGKNKSRKNSIHYTVAKEGVEIYFTSIGLTYRYDELAGPDKEEREGEKEKERGREEEEEEEESKIVSHFIRMNWLGSNPDVQIIPVEEASQYYTYGGTKKSGNTSVKAAAYKKLVYRNLYPHVDVEYTFPVGKPGIKYTLTLHPGADLSAIKMEYNKQRKINKDKNGNIIITSDFGDFVDHAPVSYDGQGKSISSSFELAGDVVSFKVEEQYNKNQDLIIDPYTTNPNISGYNAAYDVDYDTQGNIYVYGGRSTSIFQVKKFDSTLSVLKWVYSGGFVNNTTPPINRYYGDFAVDAVSQSVYIIEAENVSGTGARVVKLNASGNRIGTYPGDPVLTEMWRIVFNNCTQKAIIGGGGAQATYQVCVLDTNVTTMTPVNVLNSTEPQHDLCLLALDNSNNCYMSFARSGPYPANFNNSIIRCPGNTLTPGTTLVAKDNHDFAEAFNIVYVNNDLGAANGFNGIAVSNSWLYTYDGQLIQRWNKTTGALMKSATISTKPFTWGGIAVDECENVYVGLKNTVIKYDLNFNVLATIGATAGDVYDVKLGPKNKLYACGKDFVSSFDLVIPVCNPLMITHATTSICGGFTASVTVTGGNPGYTYYWNPGGATTSAISGTTSGIYTVTVSDGSYCSTPKIIIDTIKVIVGPGILSNTSSTDAVCGIFGSASVTASNGIPNYTYLWSNGQTTSTATGLSPGNYSVTVTDSKGCTKIDTVTVKSSGNIIAIAGPNSSICPGTILPQIISASGGINYIWSTGETTTSISVLPSATTTYTVIASTNQCADTAEVTVTVNPLPIAMFTGTNECFNDASVFNNLSVGNNTFTQLWNFGDGTTSTLLSPSHLYGGPGTYTVSLIITNNFGCKDTNQTVVVVNPLPAAIFKSAAVCLHDSTCFTDMSSISSGSIIAWNWNFGDPASGVNNISNIKSPCHVFTGLGPFSVLLTVTSDSGCQSHITNPALINAPPVALFISSAVCLNVPTDFTSTSTSAAADPIKTWNWNFGDGTSSNQANPSHTYTAAGTYIVSLIVTTAGGCKDTIDKPVTVHQLPVAGFTGGASGCMPVCVTNYTDSSTCSDLNIATWQWSFPGGSPASSLQKNPPKVCYSAAGSYGASLIVTSNYGCRDSVAITPLVNVYSLPKAEFCVAPAIAPATDPLFNFCDMWSQDVAQWSWNFGDSSPLDSINTDPIHSYSATANQNDFYTYNICLNVKTQHGCPSTICHTVELIPEFIFYIPNTFTPNGDGTNELFYGKCRGVKEYNIWVFDRWGNQIWDCHKDDKNTNWDSDATIPRQEGLASSCKWDGIVVQGGIDMGGNSRQFAQQDVYIWKVYLTDVFNKRHTYIGHVNIVR